MYKLVSLVDRIVVLNILIPGMGGHVEVCGKVRYVEPYTKVAGEIRNSRSLAKVWVGRCCLDPSMMVEDDASRGHNHYTLFVPEATRCCNE